MLHQLAIRYGGRPVDYYEDYADRNQIDYICLDRVLKIEEEARKKQEQKNKLSEVKNRMAKNRGKF